MRNLNTRSLLSALLCAVPLLALACSRGEEIVSEREETSQAATQSQPHELRPEPQSVQIEEEMPPAVPDTTAQERELAAREAEIEARERRLRDRERQARARELPRATEPEPSPEPEEQIAEAAPEPTPAAQEEVPVEEPLAAEEPLQITVTVPAGTVLDAEFTEGLASNTSSPGESFRVRVARDVMEDGEVAIPAGSEILGEVTEAVPLRRIGGKAKLGLRFTDLVLPSGVTVPIEASFVQQGRSETGKDAATIGGGAAAGAILGRVLGKGNRSKGSVIGAILGAAVGTAVASRTPGEEVVFPQGTVVSLKLDESVQVDVRPEG
jgi:type IV secretory pathway VirB10-like protein